jgi:hypothetical protein
VTAIDTSVKTCRACGRVGSQRFTRVNPRGKATFICADTGACSKRVAESAARVLKRPASNGKGRASTNGHGKTRTRARAR